jgi:hypothetical protein
MQMLGQACNAGNARKISANIALSSRRFLISKSISFFPLNPPTKRINGRDSHIGNEIVAPSGSEDELSPRQRYRTRYKSSCKIIFNDIKDSPRSLSEQENDERISSGE